MVRRPRKGTDLKTGVASNIGAGTAVLAELPSASCEMQARILGAVRAELQKKGYSPGIETDYFEPRALATKAPSSSNRPRPVSVLIALGWEESPSKVIPADLGCSTAK